MKDKELAILKEALPKCAGLSGREDFFNSAVLVMLIMIDNEYHFVFEKRSMNISQGGEICFPGGQIDVHKDRTSLDTVIREAKEELGIDNEKINIIGRLNTVFSPVGAMVDGFIGVAKLDSLKQLNINNEEVETIFTVPVSFFENTEPEKYSVRIMAHPSYVDEAGKEIVLLPAKELKLPEVYSKPWGKSRYSIYVYKYKNETIWGLTAKFIYDIIKRLKSN